MKTQVLSLILTGWMVALMPPSSLAGDFENVNIKHCNSNRSFCLEISSLKAEMSQVQPLIVLHKAEIREIREIRKNKVVLSYSVQKVTLNMPSEEIIFTDLTNNILTEIRFRMNSLEKETFRTVL